MDDGTISTQGTFTLIEGGEDGRAILSRPIPDQPARLTAEAIAELRARFATNGDGQHDRASSLSAAHLLKRLPAPQASRLKLSRRGWRSSKALRHKGVLTRAAASRLARAGWRLDESTVRHGALAAAVSLEAERLSDLPTSRVASLVAACRPLDELDLQISEVQAWAAGVPTFVEIFDGERRLSLAIQTLGSASLACAVVAGIDLKRQTYGQCWDLSKTKDRARLRYLLFEVLKPAGGHWALPCSKWSSLGGHQPDAAAHALASFTMDGLEHLDAAGCLASFEGPRTHGLVASDGWRQRFGPIEAPRGRWQYATPDGCMFGCRSPDEVPLAMQKPYVIMGNFTLELLDVQCRRGAIKPLGSGSGVDKCLPAVAEVSVAAARQLEGPRMPCDPGRVAAPGAGVNGGQAQRRGAGGAQGEARAGCRRREETVARAGQEG